MEFSRQEYLSGLPFPSPGALPDPEIKPRSPILQADSLLSELPGKPIDIQESITNSEWGWVGVDNCFTMLCYTEHGVGGGSTAGTLDPHCKGNGPKQGTRSGPGVRRPRVAVAAPSPSPVISAPDLSSV